MPAAVRAAQSAFWCLIGLSAFATPWVWRRVLALDRGGLSTAIILGVNAIGAALPMFGHSAAAAGDIGAGVRRRVLRRGGIDHRLRALQLSAGGMADRDRGDDDRVRHRPDPRTDRRSAPITDAMGSLSYALNVSAAMLAVGAMASAFQRRLAPASKSA